MALNNVKLILGIDVSNTDNDDLLRLLEENAGKAIGFYLQLEAYVSVPEELEFIQEELTVARYNKLSHEGISQESLASRSVTFSMDDLSKYAELLDNWSMMNTRLSRGNRLVML